MQLVFNCKQVVLVVLSDEVDGQTEVTKTTRSSDSVQVSLSILGEIEVDHNVNRNDIDTTCEQVSTDETASFSVLEIMENSVSIRLSHSRVDEEARVPQLVDLLSEQLYSLSRVAEDDSLTDVELGEQGVQAVELLSLFQIGVVLGETLERKLIRQTNELRVLDVSVQEFLNLHGVCCTIHHDLTLIVHHSQDVFDVHLEVHREQLVNLVKNE